MDDEAGRTSDLKTPSRVLLRRLLSRRAQIFTDAVFELDRLPPGDARAIFSRRVGLHRSWMTMRRSFLGTMFCFPLIVVLSMWLAALNADSRSWMRPDAVVFGTAAIVSLLSLYCALNLAFLRRLARALSRCSNTGAAGMLLRMHNHALKTRAWREINLELESTISECLTRLLSRFEKSDYRLLDRHERALLLNLIVGDRREPAHAAVEAVARLGDPEDIAFLARIADSPLAGRKRWTVFPGMRERAMQGILKIDERRRKEEAGGNLLRPCEPPAEETLLRTPTSAEVDSSCLLHSL